MASPSTPCPSRGAYLLPPTRPRPVPRPSSSAPASTPPRHEARLVGMAEVLVGGEGAHGKAVQPGAAQLEGAGEGVLITVDARGRHALEHGMDQFAVAVDGAVSQLHVDIA